MKNDITYNDFLPLRDGLVDFASMLLKSRDDAEDAVQDLFVKLWKRKDTLSEIENPEAYCKTVIRNICLDRLKSAEKKKQGDMPEDIADSVNVEDRAILKESLENVRKAVDELPKGQKEMIVGKAFEDMTYDEISERTGMSSQTMRTQLSLARKTLRRRFAWGFAAVAIVVAVFLAMPHRPKDTFTDPVQAYTELEKTFGYISSKIDMGEAIARSAETKLDMAEDILNKINF